MPKAKPNLTGTVTLDLTRIPDIPADADRLQIAIKSLEVTDEDSFTRAAEISGTCKDRIKKIENFFEDDKNTAHKLHASICSKIKDLSAPFRKVLEACEVQMKPFRIKQEQDKREAEDAIKVNGQAAQEELIAQAKLLRREGRIAEAKELEATAGMITTDVVLPDAKPQVEGMNERWKLKGELIPGTGLMQLVTAIAEGNYSLMQTIEVAGQRIEVPILEINPVVVKYWVEKLGEDANIPGVRVVPDVNFAHRRS
jgi:hypothetical protein